jgi:hypothetical protein
MSERGTDTSGDYEYDLVHEEVGAARAPVPRRDEHAGPPSAAGRVESDEDMSYDEAHDFER